MIRYYNSPFTIFEAVTCSDGLLGFVTGIKLSEGVAPNGDSYCYLSYFVERPDGQRLEYRPTDICRRAFTEVKLDALIKEQSALDKARWADLEKNLLEDKP